MKTKRILTALLIFATLLLTFTSLSGCSGGNDATEVYHSIDELNGKRVGVLTGSIFDKLVHERLPDATVSYMNAIADASVALNADKIDFYVADEQLARCLCAQNPNQTILGTLAEDPSAFIFKKDDEKGALLCRQMNEYIARTREDGSLDALIDLWIGPDSEKQTVDYDGLSAENGVLTYAISTNIGQPYVFVKDGKYVGYEVAVVAAFCREYGYGLKFFDTDFSGLISAVAVGKADIGSSGISVTEERKESVLFSDTVYYGGVTVVVRNGLPAGDDTGFFASIGESFEKTFIRESRWKLFLSGIGTTMLITLLSAVLGSVIGFLLFLVYRKKYKIFVSVFDIISHFLEKLPVVVIVMILFYVVFGSSNVSGTVVSVIGFTILFSFTVLHLMKTSVDAVDFGQTEAALALGYTDNRAFLRVVFPQAIKHFMPGYKSALVTLIKDTAIVGYIAVMDLTQVSDLVRSRTFEPFFPLIATALIYFLLAYVLIVIVKQAEINFDPRRRKAEKILKGVHTK